MEKANPTARIEGLYKKTTRIVEWKLTITNGATSLNNCYINVRYGDNDSGTPWEDGEKSQALGTITSATGNYELSGTIYDALPKYEDRDGTIGFQCSTSSYNTTNSLYAES
ncbi:MAG: hypothetical protein LUD02_01995 [Tannerellaceae bacterium]|nr:hypothetical protein [Tannerellaceae bacterium]